LFPVARGWRCEALPFLFLLFVRIKKICHHINNIRLDIIFSPQYGITDMLLFFNDPVELLVNRPTAEQVVAIH
jgi:hypothetical protein